jgi:hypothetical protein
LKHELSRTHSTAPKDYFTAPAHPRTPRRLRKFWSLTGDQGGQMATNAVVSGP